MSTRLFEDLEKLQQLSNLPAASTNGLVYFVDIKFRRVPPKRVRVLDSEGRTLAGLQRVELARWAAVADWDRPGAGGDIMLGVEGGLVDRVEEGVGGAPERVGFEPAIRLDHVHRPPEGAHAVADPNDVARPEGQPYQAFLSAFERVVAQDPGNESLAERARLFLTLELAASPDNDTIAASIDSALDRLGLTCRGVYRISSEDFSAHHEALGCIVERIRLMKPLRVGDIKLFNEESPVLELFERLTCIRFGWTEIPSDGALDTWDLRALLGDVASFVCGRLAVAPDGNSGLYNFAANGTYFFRVPVLAIAAARVAEMRGDARRARFWGDWARAGVFGAEVLTNVLTLRRLIRPRRLGARALFESGADPGLSWSRSDTAWGVEVAMRWGSGLDEQLRRLGAVLPYAMLDGAGG